MRATKLSPDFFKESQLRDIARDTIREMFPSNLKQFHGASMPTLSQARHNGGGVLACLRYVDWCYEGGMPREAVELMVEVLRDRIEARYGDSDDRTPIELCANEQAANAEEDQASLAYILAPTNENAMRLLFADQKHRAIKRTRAAALIRCHAI